MERTDTRPDLAKLVVILAGLAVAYVVFLIVLASNDKDDDQVTSAPSAISASSAISADSAVFAGLA